MCDAFLSGSDEIPWFNPSYAYNPAIHNLRNCVIHKLLHPGSDMNKDMTVHADLTEYLFPPDEIMESSSGAAMSLAKAASLTLSEFLAIHAGMVSKLSAS